MSGDQRTEASANSSTLDTPADEPGFSYWNDVINAPCFRSSAGYGVLAGTVLAGLQGYRQWQRVRAQAGVDVSTGWRAPLRTAGWRALDLGVKSSLVFAGAAWITCRYQYRRRREHIRRTLQVPRVKRKGDAEKKEVMQAADGVAVDTGGESG
ncbi:hypothetical protein CDCA_CDCA06G1914 [Cyanidium caldarium]|uniref:Cytochrome c oxidase assembly protein COX20, mitochondrial n=1 Tax=Cyanidium caldarium TaxID=2771 RepID=A0AAV9IUE2_CYACA|nr:hypothetical protein CDCA_CDCA06G1914 [Cyanidium caldarium]|eukprot:ctg_563.g146